MKQFAVIHIEKRKEISAVLERHITRTEVTYEQGERIEKEWAPNNADTERTRLNKELVPREIIDPETGRKKNLSGSGRRASTRSEPTRTSPSRSS